MNIDIDLIITLGGMLIGFASLIWRIGEEKKTLYDYVNNKVDKLEKHYLLNRNETSSKNQQYQYQIDKEILTINGKVDNCNHKLKRLNESIKNIDTYLQQVSIFIAKHTNGKNN